MSVQGIERVFAALFVGIAFLIAPVAHGATPAVIGEYTAWTARKVTENGKKVCFMHASPKTTRPGNVRRGEIWLLITHRPEEGIHHEVSFQAGYPFKKDGVVKVKIGGKSFHFFTHKDGAWAQDREAEPAIVKAMKKGSTAIVTGQSKRGTITTDTFSLSGFTAAYRAISKACGVKG